MRGTRMNCPLPPDRKLAGECQMTFRPLTVRQRRIYLAISYALFLFGVACHRKIDPSRLITVEHQITPQPVRVGPVRVTFNLLDASAKLVTGAHITVEADMSHAGMSPVFAEAKETQPGRYQADLALGMAGDWVVLLHGTLPGGEKLERQFDVSGVRSDVGHN